MYEKYFGEDYYDKVRKMLTADHVLLPDSIIDAEVNVGAALGLLSSVLDKTWAKRAMENKPDISSQDADAISLMRQAAIHYLCGVLCVALRSRTKTPPFNTKEHIRRWGKKRGQHMKKGDNIMAQLLGY